LSQLLLQRVGPVEQVQVAPFQRLVAEAIDGGQSLSEPLASVSIAHIPVAAIVELVVVQSRAAAGFVGTAVLPARPAVVDAGASIAAVELRADVPAVARPNPPLDASPQSIALLRGAGARSAVAVLGLRRRRQHGGQG
jgi:hypothetical protein